MGRGIIPLPFFLTSKRAIKKALSPEGLNEADLSLHMSAKHRSRRALVGWRSFLSAFASICRILSLVTSKT